MLEPNQTYARIQSMRINNLEDQVHLMRRELQRLNEGILHQNEIVKLNNLLERLKELNLILVELRNYYNCSKQYIFQRKKNMMCGNSPRARNCYTVQQKESSDENNEGDVGQEDNFEGSCYKYKPHQRTNAGFDQIKSGPETSRASQLSKRQTDTSNIREKVNEPFQTCKQLMDESKSPSSILGNYLVRLQDFRTDPELRRKRWEKKQQEKLQELYKRKHIKLSSEAKDDLVKKSNCLAVFKEHNKELVKTSGCNSIRQCSEIVSDVSFGNLAVIKNNLSKVIDEIIDDIDRKAIALTVVLENDLVYHVNVSQISNGHSLSCFLATEEAIQEAKRQYLFQDLLTLFVVKADNSKIQKDRILGHLFEFV